MRFVRGPDFSFDGLKERILEGGLDQAGVTGSQSCKSCLDRVTRFHPYQLDR